MIDAGALLQRCTRDSFGCLLWGGAKADGYGVINIDGKTAYMHRLAYEDAHGPIPDGYEVDHECRRRNCCALAHLVLVTRAENERRKRWRNRVKQRECRLGHDLRLWGMVTPEGGRVCRQCR